VSQDHFVAQTYLRHWVHPGSQLLYGYSKPSGKEFPCHTKDVCREWNWDTNPRFKNNPQLLADFRKMFEPHWNPTIGAIRSGSMSVDDRFALAGYWAQLTTCTPAWHRNAVELYEQRLLDFIPLIAENVARKNPEHKAQLEKAVAKGQIKPKVDEDFVKGILTAHLTDATFLLYEQDWALLLNDTGIPFITSDNPSSVLPRRAFSDPLTRFLPLAPDLAIVAMIDPGKKREVDPATALTNLRPGLLRRYRIQRRAAARFNRIVAMNADTMVLCSEPDRHVRRLVRNHRRFGIDILQEKFRTPDGYISGSTLMVRQRKAGA
jgi:hypothetical protein